MNASPNFILTNAKVMLPKKNPEIEVNRFGILYFQVGLCVMMLFAYIAIESKTYDISNPTIETVSMEWYNEDIYEKEIPAMTIQQEPTVPAPIALNNVGIKIVDNLMLIEETSMQSTETNQMEIVGKVTENHTPILKVDDIKIKEVDEEVEVPFAAIENVPVYPGCEKGTKEEIKACFERSILQHISKNFVYPEKAMERELYGRVFVMFTIDKSGSVTNIQLRGPDKILEDEAERIIKLLPKMIPGKQRGKPTKVKYSVPIYFKYVEL